MTASAPAASAERANETLIIKPPAAEADAELMNLLRRLNGGATYRGEFDALPRDIPLFAPPVVAKWLRRLGYSHAVVFDIPQGIDIAIEKQTHITVTGVDRQLVGQVAGLGDLLQDRALAAERLHELLVEARLLHDQAAYGEFDPFVSVLKPFWASR